MEQIEQVNNTTVYASRGHLVFWKDRGTSTQVCIHVYEDNCSLTDEQIAAIAKALNDTG